MTTVSVGLLKWKLLFTRKLPKLVSNAIVLQLFAMGVADILSAFGFVLISKQYKSYQNCSFQIWHLFYHNKWCSKSGSNCILTHKVLIVGAEVD